MYQLYNIDDNKMIYEGTLKEVIKACDFYEGLGYNMAICKGSRRLY